MRTTLLRSSTLAALALGFAAPSAAPGPSAGRTPPADGEAPRYEMTTYYVGFLYRGPKWTPEVTPELEKLQAAHLANISRLAETGKLLLAGPFSDGGNLRGMFVFQVESLEEARALCDTDPAVQAGRLTVELHPWYSAKGIRIVQEPKPDATKPDATKPDATKPDATKPAEKETPGGE